MNVHDVKARSKIIELSVFTAMLIAANFTLLFGHVCEPLAFFPAQVSTGEWWRVLTFPFVHVSGYHLLLDAGAFLLLYHGLREPSAIKRLGLVIACAASSLGVSLMSAQLTNGLCGLSGVAHGLMAVSALELMQTKDNTLRPTGVSCLAIVVIKSLYEGLSGHVLFNSLHFGSVGNAVAICHAGGVLGGLCAYAVLRTTTGVRRHLNWKTVET
jgi:rhomboid family GlyGly-CTERM serine protease